MSSGGILITLKVLQDKNKHARTQVSTRIANWAIHRT